MRINPCFCCPLRVGCPDKAAWKAKASATGFRSVTFDCARLTAELRPGRNIEIEIPRFEDERYYSEDSCEIIMGRKLVRATIVSAYGSKFSCVVEPGQISEDEICPTIRDKDKIRFRKSRRHTTIKRFLTGPDATIRQGCGHIVRDGRCDIPVGEDCYFDPTRNN